MPNNLTMPKLSDTMTEGRLITWKKSVGDQVERGDIIAEVETDKANMELESFSSGVLLEQRVKPGEMVAVGTIIGVVGAAGEEAGKQPEMVPEQPTAEAIQPVVEKTQETAQPSPAVAREVSEPTPGRPEDEDAAGQRNTAGGKASPLVRRLARERGVDLSKIAGSGPEGRILQEDLERLSGEQKQGMETRETTARETEKAPVQAGQPLSRMRSAIARKVSESWQQIPHFTVTVVVNIGEAEKGYRELKSSGTQISLNDFIIKAAAVAIGKFPQINASFSPDGLIFHDQVNIGVAVDVEDGLLVPVISGCQSLSLKEIGRRSREAVEKARKGTISEADISGGTFSISNMGMLGVEQFSAIIYPPQGAILAVAAALNEAVVKEGQVVPARIMRMTLSADHRLIDGAYAARFMMELKHLLENPLLLVV